MSSGASAELLRRGLHAQRRSAIGWTVGVVALTLISGSVWPTIKNSGMTEALGSMDPRMLEAFGAADFVTPAGYMDGQLYALLLPLVLSGMAIAATATLTVGDEEAGRLELVAALPLTRRRLFLTRLAAVGLVLLGLSVATLIAMVAMRSPFDLDIPGGRLVSATAACMLLAAFHAGIVYVCAGFGASRAAALGVSITVLVAGYVADFLFPLSDRLDGLQRISPWWWGIGTKPLGQGVDLGGAAALAAVTVLLVVAGTWRYGRRDLRGA